MNIVSSVHTRFTLLVMEEGFGPFIKARREAEHLTQAELAKLSGIGKSHLSQIEAGKIGLPSAEIRRRLANELHTTNLELLIAAGELTREEANPENVPTLDPETYAVVRLVIDYLQTVRDAPAQIRKFLDDEDATAARFEAWARDNRQDVRYAGEQE